MFQFFVFDLELQPGEDDVASLFSEGFQFENENDENQDPESEGINIFFYTLYRAQLHFLKKINTLFFSGRCQELAN